MSRTAPQLIEAIVLDAAYAVLKSPAYAGQQIDPLAFAQANRATLLELVARAATLRAELAQTYRDELRETHPQVVALLGESPTDSATAAAALRDPRAIRARRGRAKPSVKTGADGEQSAVADEHRPAELDSATARRLERYERRLTETRAARDRARVQRDYARAETDQLRRDLETAEEDRDESLAVIAGLRAELAAERDRVAELATDVPAAAAVLKAAILPPPPGLPMAGDIDIDPREREATVDTPPAETAPIADPRVAAALTRADVSPDVLLALVNALLEPPAPATPVWVGEPREIALTPLGGGTDIGGSCMLVTVGNVRILIDAGMRVNKRIDQAGPEYIDVALAGPLATLVITHAHKEHAVDEEAEISQ
ncbi:hypothetical protein ACFXO7_00885, partial [Nocardia tengchongensis]|uniref:hypothetical protein n=1 Tax=Nocardia tengchongensis TaxID=2055889 RepID=UPI00368B4230